MEVVPYLVHVETKYSISRRILQRTRAKLSKLGPIEHVSYLKRLKPQHCRYSKKPSNSSKGKGRKQKVEIAKINNTSILLGNYSRRNQY